ncbi:MAG: short-chain dehydrogenase [Candidatus Zixiibacteriota bacterium]
MSHVLVVGGTGMLRKVVLHFARQGCWVSVVARTSESMTQLLAESRAATGQIDPIIVDYSNESALRLALADAVAARGPFRLAVIWIHSDSPRALVVVAETLGAQGSECNLFHIMGSCAADPSKHADQSALLFAGRTRLTYHSIVLGFKTDGVRSRWLTDEEICDGVIHAIETDAAEHVVGTVRPWSKRPS